MISDIPRVRFAPSPTGYLHVGGLRTALYNYLYAKHNSGKFILRIEDTDRNRYVEGAVENLISTLNWIGLEYDEGPNKEGEYGPYLQSERLDIYKKYSDQLVESGRAYHCFCSAERLTALREEQQSQKLQAKYDKHCLSLSKEEIQSKIEAGDPYVIRLNVEPSVKIEVNDLIRGVVEFNSDVVDDQILLKSDGFPTYHLANVVDDHLMKITHVIRGEEWLPSTPKHILLYDYLGWEKPLFAHLPLLLNPDKSKLSKRQGDVAVEDYKLKGYLKESLINFVALLGWTAGDDKEYYYIDELVNSFSIERVNKSGAVFNIEKLKWLNEEHLRKKPLPEIISLLKEEIAKTKYADNNYSDSYLGEVIHSMLERVSFVHEFIEKSPYYFDVPESYDPAIISKRWKNDTNDKVKLLAEAFNEVTENKKEEYELLLKRTAESLGIGAGELIHPLRLALSGMGTGPGVYDIAIVLGKEETIKRLNTAIEKIKV